MCLKDASYGTPEKALYNMGFANLKMKNVDKAIEYYEKSLAMGPENVNTLYYLARAYLEKKENAKALAQLKKVVAADPKFQDAEYQLGLLYEEQKNYPLALGAFRRAVKVDSSNIDAQLHLGLCLVNLGEKDEGAKNLEIVARIDPQGTAGKQAAEELAKVKTDHSDHKFRGIPKVSVR
jgi:tetratricopeptide (TPR) repeat protein